MDNENTKVFFSSIVRNRKKFNNDYKDILNVVPAKPIVNATFGIKTCDYIPKYGKQYIPKKKTGSKVKTVRDIRLLFEKDSYSELTAELEKQEDFLFRKIRFGHSKNVKLRGIAAKMIKSKSPLSKSIWQMLMNINPEDNLFPTQFMLWNGKHIQVNGSRGGNNKFICMRNVERKDRLNKNNIGTIQKQRNRLLQNSLHINFKPGPLSRKKYLDISYQKDHIGNTEIVRLPKPALEIQLAYAKPVTPDLSAFLFHSFAEDSNKAISEKWADFALSTLGKNVNGSFVQLIQNNNVTFDLDYKFSQNRLLMRHNNEYVTNKKYLCNNLITDNGSQEESSIDLQVNSVVNDILIAVEISLQQDNMYTGEDELRDTYIPKNESSRGIQSREKAKKKYCELERLDVTVIRLTEKTIDKPKCLMSHCKLGCICDSLSCTYNIKEHCGRIECMFKCKCDFLSYQISDLFENGVPPVLPEIISSNVMTVNKNSKLAKEEQKFHQTVIVTDEKSIVLKSRKRNSKTSKKYADFYSQMHCRSKNNLKKELSVVTTKLDCSNIEPLCLVHNLYRCFCKGTFTHTPIITVEENKVNGSMCEPLSLPNEDINTTKILDVTNQIDRQTSETLPEQLEPESGEIRIKSLRVKSRLAKQNTLSEKSVSMGNDIIDLAEETVNNTSARVQAYGGRNYSNKFYSQTHEKIKELETNDKTLQIKLMSLVNKKDSIAQPLDKTTQPFTTSTTSSEYGLCELLSSVAEDSVRPPPKELDKCCNETDTKRLPHKSKLVSWLEMSYKQYKLKFDQGLNKMYLGPPQIGKLALYPWDFILSRYQDRKNYFLVSRKKPYRLFMAVNENNVYFDGCININNIPRSEIDEFPITVKHLLSETPDLKDNFCILNGLSHCWELIGSVTKVNEKESAHGNLETLHKSNNSSREIWDVENIPENKNSSKWLPVSSARYSSDEEYEKQRPESQDTDISESSKWFIMTVENDFSEIQFYKKGFFVKYDSVIKAINVARISGKTVRLSSQKCNNQPNSPQFGIYAIPTKNDSCVFIGPYEKDENLGMETIKTITQGTNKPTRGIWITLKKTDNHKVIDNPLMYIPKISNSDQIISLNTHLSCDTMTTSQNCSENKLPSEPKTTLSFVKTVKPIKIRKTNGFYQLAPNGILQHFSHTSPEKSSPNDVKVNHAALKNISLLETISLENKSIFRKKYIAKRSCRDSNKMVKKPVAEIAPQIKTKSQCTADDRTTQTKKKIEGGMFVLRPEEINKRSKEGTISTEQFLTEIKVNDVDTDDDVMDLDIDNFLATNEIKAPPNSDIYIISDDDDDPTDHTDDIKSRKEYIICQNIETLGWIQGRRDSDNRLSFIFPGFKESDFYKEEDAYEKINQVFSRKVYVPKYITLQWRTSDDSSVIASKTKLEAKTLTADYIMTKKGLRHKSELLNSIILKEDSQSSEALATTSLEDLKNKKGEFLMKLCEISDKLEMQGDILRSKALIEKKSLVNALGGSSADSQVEPKKEFDEMTSDVLLVDDETI